jgi:hypothetical protein
VRSCNNVEHANNLQKRPKVSPETCERSASVKQHAYLKEKGSEGKPTRSHEQRGSLCLP